MIIALTSSILEFGSLKELTSCSPLGFEREVSLFPAPAVCWLVLILNTASCHIFEKFHLAGCHAFGKFMSAGCSFSC